MMFHCASNPSSIRKAILLINFGTPSSSSPKAVHTFLLELFQDQPSYLPQCVQHLVARTCIIPFCISKAISRYQAIWTEEGSPLLVYMKRLAHRLSTLLPSDTAVAIAMQYGEPSIEQALQELQEKRIEEIIILPLFPQPVPSLTQSIVSTVFQQLLQWPVLPRITCIPELYKEPWYVQAFAQRLLLAHPEYYDHVLFSFHAIPEGRSPHSSSYKDACVRSAEDIARVAELPTSTFSISFQSRVGYGRWTTPSTRDTLNTILSEEKKRVLVICPSFVVDCIETLGEVAGEYRANFLNQGGEALGLVECLNDFQPFVEGIAAFITSKGSSL